MSEITVLLTGVGGGGHGEQILKALRLAKTPYKIIGADMSPHSKGLLEVDIPYILPPANAPDYVESLLKICRKHGASVVIHGSEVELLKMSSASEEIRAQGLFLPINPPGVIELCMDKLKTCEFLKRAGFTVPEYRRITSMADLKTINSLPAVLKPSKGGGGSANVFLAQTQDDLSSFARYLLSLYSEFIMQEYVGTAESEFTVGVLISMDGELLNSIAVKRSILSTMSTRIRVPNRTGKANLGPVLALSTGISQGEIGPFPEVTKTCERIAMSLGCRGAVNVQCRLLENRVCVFEINPRFSGTTSLRAMVGYNEPDVLIRKHLLGDPIVPHFPYQSGVITRGLAEVFAPHPHPVFPRAQDL